MAAQHRVASGLNESAVHDEIAMATVIHGAKRAARCEHALHVFCVAWVEPLIDAEIEWASEANSSRIQTLRRFFRNDTLN